MTGIDFDAPIALGRGAVILALSIVAVLAQCTAILILVRRWSAGWTSADWIAALSLPLGISVSGVVLPIAAAILCMAAAVRSLRPGEADRTNKRRNRTAST